MTGYASFALHLILLFAFLPASNGSGFYVTAADPIILKLQRVKISVAKNQSENNSSSPDYFITSLSTPPRTKPSLFSNVLKLKPNMPFTFERTLWEALKDSKLFYNLAFRSVAMGDRMALEVSGLEAPSIRISPELTVSGSITKPEVSGGVQFFDRNFRGSGEKVQCFVGKKESPEEGTNDLAPLIRFLWSECDLGSFKTLSAGFDQDVSLELAEHSLPTTSDPSTVVDWSGRWVELLTQRAFLRLVGASFVTPTRDKTVALGLSVEPYASRTTLSLPPSLSTRLPLPKSRADMSSFGVKSSITITGMNQGGSRLVLDVDDGVTVSSRGSDPFRVLAMRLHLPSWRSTLKVRLPNWLLSRDSTSSSSLVDVPVQAGASLSASRASGPGAVPLSHLSRAGSPNQFRGPRVGGPGPGGGGDAWTTSHAALHGDVYLNELIGAFVDTGVYSTQSSPELRGTTSVGVGVRLRGLCCEVAWSVGGELCRPLIHLGGAREF